MGTDHSKRHKKTGKIAKCFSILNYLPKNNNIISIKPQLEHIWEYCNNDPSGRTLITVRSYTGEIMSITIEGMLSLNPRNVGRRSWLNVTVCD